MLDPRIHGAVTEGRSYRVSDLPGEEPFSTTVSGPGRTRAFEGAVAGADGGGVAGALPPLPADELLMTEGPPGLSVVRT